MSSNSRARSVQKIRELEAEAEELDRKMERLTNLDDKDLRMVARAGAGASLREAVARADS